MANWQDCPAVERIPGWLGGVWVFKDTRLPVYFLYRHIAGGGTVDGFAKWYGIDISLVKTVVDHEANQLRKDRAISLSAVVAEASASMNWRERLHKIGQFLMACVIFAAVFLALVTFGDAALGENTIHAGLTAMCAASILIAQPFSGIWSWVQRIAQPLAGLVALASGLLWTARDASRPAVLKAPVMEEAVIVSPVDPSFLGLLGILAAVCLGFSVIVAGLLWSMSDSPSIGRAN